MAKQILRGPETVARTVDDLLLYLGQLSDARDIAICRGQADAKWRLQPSLDRDVKAGSAYADRLAEERQLTETFCREIEHLLGDAEEAILQRHGPDDLIPQNTVMQHFGAPTRLLDWTRSPFVAAFFACISLRDIDGAVWWYRERALVDAVGRQWKEPGIQNPDERGFDHRRHFYSEHSPEILIPVHLVIPFARAEAQQGQFTMAGRLGLLHDDLLDRLIGPDKFGKIVVPWNIKTQVLSALKARNVTARSLEHVGADRLGLELARRRRDMLKLA